MKKLKLKLDDLRIDSFDTAEPQKAKGTVLGEETGPTCNASCNNSCVANPSCDEWTACGTCAYDTCNCGIRTTFC